MRHQYRDGGVAEDMPGRAAENHLAQALRANGIAAEAITLPAGKISAGEVILAKAEEFGCDLIVKGAYTQSRLRQMIFGGTTRHILGHATVPVLMAH